MNGQEEEEEDRNTHFHSIKLLFLRNHLVNVWR
jgi:hypothetical protein